MRTDQAFDLARKECPMTAIDLAPATTHRTLENDVPTFALQAAQGSLVCNGERDRPALGSADNLATRVADFFAGRTGGPDMLVGALPFDRSAADCLFQPKDVWRTNAPTEAPATVTDALDHNWQLISAGAPTQYAAAVSQALKLLGGTAATDTATLRKVVLARNIILEADRPVDILHVARRLASSRHATTFNVRLPSDAHSQRHLVGASPELLIAKTGNRIYSHPLAGSALRHANPSKDEAAAQTLAQSDKDQREHEAVVEAVLDTLAPYCSQLPTNPVTSLRATDNLWHLGTPIAGVLKQPDTSSAELAAALHPTPAVCGLPRQPAYAVIHDLESFDRGFYAGAVGWTDAAGDGEWHVAIRCAEIEAARVRLYAGAGIVPGSDPLRETQETAAKFAVMLQALGVAEASLNHILKGVS